jgi:tetratricopeptide (TPR) repeat protein
MIQKYLLLFLAAAVLLISFSCTEKMTKTVFSGPYLGQESPGKTPQLFMPGLVSTPYYERSTGFLDRGRVCVFQHVENKKTRTYYMSEKEGRWTEPLRAPFENERGGTDFTVAPDHKTLVFQSGRPAFAGDTIRDSNAWTVEWTGSGWTVPRLLPHPANTDEYGEGYPSLAPDGSLYFFTWSKEECLLGDVFRSLFINGKYLDHERFGYPINTAYHENDPCIAPDNSYILVESGRPGGCTYFDTYISFRKENGGWTSLHNLGKAVNANCPGLISVTPDGRYFFFTALGEPGISKGEEVGSEIVERWGDYDTFWVETSLFDDIREEVFHKRSAAEVVALEYQENGLDAATGSLKRLYRNSRETFFFELSELMMLCGKMVEAENIRDADAFYQVLLETFPDEFRIKLGYAQANILNGRAEKGLGLLSALKSGIRPLLFRASLSHYVWELGMRMRPGDAEMVLRFFIKEFPDDHNAHFDLAEVLDGRGERDEAVKYCRKALELKPDFGPASELLQELEKK